MDGSLGGANKSIESAFPYAVQTGIGVNAHKKPILPTSANGNRFDGCNFHRWFDFEDEVRFPF
jgi:hypothetical protein